MNTLTLTVVHAERQGWNLQAEKGVCTGRGICSRDVMFTYMGDIANAAVCATDVTAAHAVATLVSLSRPMALL